MRAWAYFFVFITGAWFFTAQVYAQTSVPILSTFLGSREADRKAEEKEPDVRRPSGFFENEENKDFSKRRFREFTQLQEEHADKRSRQKGVTGPDKKIEEKPSSIERMYSRRIVSELTQYGYDLFGVPKKETRQVLAGAAEKAPALPAGAVQDDFVLNTGDEVEIVFSGQRTDREKVKINSEGVLLIEDFPPIPAAGRTIGQVRISLEAAAANLYNTQAYISLASVRQIGVLVVGHVQKPGRQNLTVFHTVLDALMEAGGVDKTGSLRRIKLVRHGRSTIIDLYNLLMHGAAHIDMQLRDGDKIIIPPIGPTVAIAGEVKRPGIYEILPELKGMHHRAGQKSQKISLNDMLDFSGGLLAPGDNRTMRLSLTDGGEEKVKTVSDPFQAQFGDGDILMVSKGLEKRTDSVELIGHTRKPGFYALKEHSTLSSLLSGAQVLGPEIYPLIGVIERWDPAQLTDTMLGFPLNLVISGDYDRKLQDGDAVYLFSHTQIRNLRPDSEGTRLAAAAAAQESIEQGSGFQGPGLESEFIVSPAMRSFLTERAAFVRGAVRREGAYPVADGVSLAAILAVAGGLALEADTGNIEITSAYLGRDGPAHGRNGSYRKRVSFRRDTPGDIEIHAGDSIRVNQKFKKVEDQSVLIIGEVENPGRYDLVPGDRLSNLFARAGGLSRYAYPEGAIFSRRSERLAEEQRFRAAARDLQRAIAVALEKEDGPSPAQVAQAQELVSELETIQAVGRITVEADPAVLKTEPELDILLEAGDRIYIPRRPLTVRVSGEVLSPASLQFRESKEPLDYISEAGSFTFNADKDRTFVLYPDGSARPIQVSSWNYRPVFIPPGSTVVVPRDPEPFDFIQSAKDISQILSNLAITGVFIDDVRDDD